MRGSTTDLCQKTPKVDRRFFGNPSEYTGYVYFLLCPRFKCYFMYFLEFYTNPARKWIFDWLQSHSYTIPKFFWQLSLGRRLYGDCPNISKYGYLLCSFFLLDQSNLSVPYVTILSLGREFACFFDISERKYRSILVLQGQICPST